MPQSPTVYGGLLQRPRSIGPISMDPLGAARLPKPGRPVRGLSFFPLSSCQGDSESQRREIRSQNWEAYLFLASDFFLLDSVLGH